MAKAKKVIKKNSRKKETKTVKKAKKVETKDTATKVLLVIFLILCVVVFVLATIMITNNKTNSKDKADISIPLTKEELDKGISIDVDMSDVLKNESIEYRIEATNYIKNNINKEVVNYQIKISSEAKVDVELYSNKEDFELLNGKMKLTKQRLGKDKKEKTNYILKITQRQNPTEKELVNVKFETEK